MAEIYVDLALATGLNDGTDWTNAYNGVAGFISAGAAAAAGDNIWVKNSVTITASPKTYAFSNGTRVNPVKIYGVLAATTNTPPVQADLIPGLRTGNASRAYAHADLPILDQTTAGGDHTLTGSVYVYGLGFKAIDIGAQSTGIHVLEECLVKFVRGVHGANAGSTVVKYINCGGSINNLYAGRGSQIEIMGFVANQAVAATGVIGNGGNAMEVNAYGCDFSDAASTLVTVSAPNNPVKFSNTQMHASGALTTGTFAANGQGRFEFYQTENATGKTTGNTIMSIQHSMAEGDVEVETTAVRTGGASDGVTPWSFAMTPNASETLENYRALISPWMAFKIAGDGTAKTVTVYIANSGAADYNDDDVWLEVLYPSEGGTAQFDFVTTQMNLLDTTPNVVADDTASTWGTGGNNPQKLVATVSPDYTGRAYCRVHFAKFWASGMETLYVDPLPEVA